MTILQSLILGVIQGITEFLPISSSAHLEIFARLFSVKQHTLLFDIVLHFSTLLVILVYFRKKLLNIPRDIFSREKGPRQASRKLFLNILLSSIPVIAFYFLINDYLDNAFKDPKVISGMLILVGVFLIGIDRVFNHSRKTLKELKPTSALFIGFFQALALVRGVSRSGISIIAGGLLKLNKDDATEYAFLAGIPVLAGSFLLKVFELIQGAKLEEPITPIIIGFIFAFISGYLSINFLFKFIKKYSFSVFGIYRILLGLLILIIL